MTGLSRKRLFEIVEVSENGDAVSRAFDIGMSILILLNVIAVTLETVDPIGLSWAAPLRAFEVFSVAVFSIDYVVRVWVAVESPQGRFSRPLAGRLRYMATPMALIDLIAVLPFYLAIFVNIDLRFLRVFRILRVLKLTRYSSATDALLRVFHNERRPLFAAFSVMMTLLMVLSGLIYFIESDAQPEAFGSIPAAMWWGVATLTTVGFGDVVPITPLGKVLGAGVTILGLGMFALPAAIFANGFATEARRRDFLVTWNMVANVPIFAHLAAVDIAAIARLLHSRMAVPGECIISKGEAGDRMFFIASGRVEVELGRQKKYLPEGDYFGEIAVLYDRPRTATVCAVQTCQLLVLEADDFRALLEKHPHLLIEIDRTAGRRLAGAQHANTGE